MTPKERFEELQILMPGTPDRILNFLAAENGVTPWETQHEETCQYKEPVQDFFLKFRIDSKEKLQRILNCCGEMGASWLRNRHFYWNRERVNNEAGEFAIVAEATRQLNGELQGEELADAVNAVVANGNSDVDPWQNFDAFRAARVMHCDDVLKSVGRYEGKSMRDCNKLLRALVRKVEIDSRNRTAEELLGLATPRHLQPHVVFADGRFGDGARWIREVDANGNVRQYKERQDQAMLPELAGMADSEKRELINSLIQKQLEKRAAQKS